MSRPQQHLPIAVVIERALRIGFQRVLEDWAVMVDMDGRCISLEARTVERIEVLRTELPDRAVISGLQLTGAGRGARERGSVGRTRTGPCYSTGPRQHQACNGIKCFVSRNVTNSKS